MSIKPFMKNLLAITLLIISVFPLMAQVPKEKIMDERVREFHRVLGLSNKEDYKQFMRDNYSKEFLERPINLSRVVDTDGVKEEEKGKPLDNLDAKAQMYSQLHNDFGRSKISSIRNIGDKIELMLKANGLEGKFTIGFGKDSPYLLESMGIEVEMGEEK